MREKVGRKSLVTRAFSQLVEINTKHLPAVGKEMPWEDASPYDVCGTNQYR